MYWNIQMKIGIGIDLSENSGIQLQDIINHPDLPWKW